MRNSITREKRKKKGKRNWTAHLCQVSTTWRTRTTYAIRVLARPAHDNRKRLERNRWFPLCLVIRGVREKNERPPLWIAGWTDDAISRQDKRRRFRLSRWLAPIAQPFRLLLTTIIIVIMWSDPNRVIFLLVARGGEGKKEGKRKKTRELWIIYIYIKHYRLLFVQNITRHVHILRRESTLSAKLCHCVNTFPSVIAHLPYRFTFLFPFAFKSSIS